MSGGPPVGLQGRPIAGFGAVPQVLPGLTSSCCIITG